MSVGVGSPALGDDSRGGVVRVVVVPDDHGKAAAGLAIGEPVGADAGRLERRYDLIEHVRDASLEVGRGLFSKAITCAFIRSSSRGEREGLMPATEEAEHRASRFVEQLVVELSVAPERHQRDNEQTFRSTMAARPSRGTSTSPRTALRPGSSDSPLRCPSSGAPGCPLERCQGLRWSMADPA